MTTVRPLAGGWSADLQVRAKNNKTTIQGRCFINNTIGYIEFSSWSDQLVSGYLLEPSNANADCTTKTMAALTNMGSSGDNGNASCKRYNFTFARTQ